jgi:hypothetical protein
VEQDTRQITSFGFALLDMAGRVKEDGLSCVDITPLSPSAVDAKLFVPEPDPPKLIIQAGACTGVIRYRVKVDLTHSQSA